MRVTTEDLIQVGRRQIKFKVTSRLPRVIVYNKVDGEIVSGRTSIDGGYRRMPSSKGTCAEGVPPCSSSLVFTKPKRP